MRYGFVSVPLLLLLVLPSLAAAQKITVTRDLPAEVSPGVQFAYIINIAVNPDDVPVSFGVGEILPSGWDLISVNMTHTSFEDSTDTYSWFFGVLDEYPDLPPVSDATIELTIEPAASSGSFSGSWYTDYEDGPIAGDTQTQVNQQGGDAGGQSGGTPGFEPSLLLMALAALFSGILLAGNPRL